MKHGTLRAPRRRKHVDAALDYLAACGATDVSVTQNRHVHLRWRAGGRPMAISLSASPGETENCARVARQLIRRRYRAAGLEVRA